jgi:hypothetical protein
MIEILQWTTLIASGAAALSRIPNLVRRKNRSIFYALALLTLAILLSIRGPYLAIDALLGHTNVANLAAALHHLRGYLFPGPSDRNGLRR